MDIAYCLRPLLEKQVIILVQCLAVFVSFDKITVFVCDLQGSCTYKISCKTSLPFLFVWDQTDVVGVILFRGLVHDKHKTSSFTCYKSITLKVLWLVAFYVVLTL